MQNYPLYYFKAIAETENITQAAELLSISAPALSNSLRRLEDDLGVQLFDRVGRNLVLNQYGKAYLPYARKILDLHEQGTQRMRQMKKEKENCITVADTTYVYASYLISQFLDAYPDTTLHRSYFAPEQCGNLDLVRSVDYIIGSTNGVHRPDLCYEKLRSGSTVSAVVNRLHPFATRKTVAIHELLTQTIIAYPADMPGRKMVDTLFSNFDSIPDIVYEGNSPHAMVPALERNLGVFLQPTHTAQFYLQFYPNCVAIPVTGCSYQSDTSLFWDPNRKLSISAKKFRQFCREFCTKELPLL